MSTSRKLFGAFAAAALTLGITACTPPNENDSTEPSNTQVLTTSQTATPTTTGAEETETFNDGFITTEPAAEGLGAQVGVPTAALQ